MKRLIKILSCVLLLLLVPVTAWAENSNSFANAGELYAYWQERNGFPAYITGVWSSDGGLVNFTFGVTDDAAGHAGAQEILALVEDDDTVAIAYQTYTWQYLRTVQSDAERYLDADVGFKAVGINSYTNRVEVDVAQARLDDPNTATAISTLREKYADAVFFQFTSTEYIPVIGGANAPAGSFYDPIGNRMNTQMPLIFFLSAASLLLLAALSFSEYKRRKLFLLLANGTAVVASSEKLSCRAVKEAIRNSAAEPSHNLDARIRDAANGDTNV